MGWFSDKGFWVDLISYASIFSAAIFGMMGLFTEYKKDGKVTRWGHLAVGGIAMSAVFAMTSAVLQKQISSEEQAAGAAAADRQRHEQQGQFNTQLGQLLRLNGQMQGVNRDNRTLLANMNRSLAWQELLLANARRSMLMTAGLGAQERQNTGRVLQTMWADANRVSPSSIAVTIGYRCPFGLSGASQPFPRLLAENASLELRVAPMEEARAEAARFNLFSQNAILSVLGTMGFSSFSQESAFSRNLGSYGGEAVQVSRFTAFQGSPMGRWEDPRNWEGAAIEVVVTGFAPGLMAQAIRGMGDRPALGNEIFDGLQDPFVLLPGNEISYSILPCPITMFVEVNGRRVASASGRLAQVLGRRPGDDAGVVVVKFPIVEASRNVFPDFGE